MTTLISGLVALATILYLTLGSNLGAYVQWHSFILVVGGTAALFLLTTPQSILFQVGSSIFGALKPDRKFSFLQDELQQLMKTRTLSQPSQNELVQYATDLWLKGVDSDLFIALISERKVELDSKLSSVTQALKNLAKYPPALGMCGTVIGMIGLFSVLDSSKDNIGTSLSAAMTATFLGLFLSNFLLSPLADRLHIKQIQQNRLYENIYEVLLLINRDEPSVLIQEEINDRSA